MNRLFTTTATIFCVAFSLMAFAADNQSAKLEQQLEQTKARLNLSDEQAEALYPVLKGSMTEQRRILSTYGVSLDNRANAASRLSMKQALAMRKELEAVRDETRSALVPILSDQQMDEFQHIQDERRAEMRDRIRGGR